MGTYNEDRVGEPQPTDKEYVDIIRSETEVDAEVFNDQGQPTKISYYCHDCKKLVQPKRVGKKFQFSCAECKSNKVSFGSEKSIQSYYKTDKSK